MKALYFFFFVTLLISCGEHEYDDTQQIEPFDSIPQIFDTLTSNAYSKAWEDTLRPIIIDAYGLNGIDWAKMQTDKRVIAIIHKASQGLKTADKYQERRKKAKALGYLWGSYHLGTSDDPTTQADLYLKTIDSTTGEIIALDLEDISKSKFMNLENALVFIKRIHEKTGRYPFLYCNHSVLKAISKKYKGDSLFSKCPLWYARFTSTIKGFKNDTWTGYTFWQFSCELNCTQTGDCLYNVAGTRYDMDVNVFYGGTAELKARWGTLNAN